MTAPELRAIRSDLLAALAKVDSLITSVAAPTVGREVVDVIGMDRTKAIELVLEQAGRPMRPVEIWAELHRLGRDDPKMETQVTTNGLYHRGRIGKVGTGQYIAEPVAATIVAQTR